MHEHPHEGELQAAEAQNRLGYLSDGCVVLLVVCLYLKYLDFPIASMAWISFLVLSGSLLARIHSIFKDGFFARGNYLVRDNAGIAQALVRLVGELLAGIVMLGAISA